MTLDALDCPGCERPIVRRGREVTRNYPCRRCNDERVCALCFMAGRCSADPEPVRSAARRQRLLWDHELETQWRTA